LDRGRGEPAAKPYDDPDYLDLLTDTESIFEGTWSSGEPPAAFIDFQVMREMHWTFRELQETPIEVRTYAWDAIRKERAAQHAQIEKQKRAAERQQGAQVIEY
jgi:hypothetical protein